MKEHDLIFTSLALPFSFGLRLQLWGEIPGQPTSPPVHRQISDRPVQIPNRVVEGKFSINLKQRVEGDQKQLQAVNKNKVAGW